MSHYTYSDGKNMFLLAKNNTSLIVLPDAVKDKETGQSGCLAASAGRHSWYGHIYEFRSLLCNAELQMALGQRALLCITLQKKMNNRICD